MPFDGDYTQEKYASQMLDAYKKAGIPPATCSPKVSISPTCFTG